MGITEHGDDTKPARRVSDADIDREIIGTQFHCFESTCVTVCCLTLWNGFAVVGQSACADPINFDAELGKTIAMLEARQKVRELLTFRLRDDMAPERA